MTKAGGTSGILHQEQSVLTTQELVCCCSLTRANIRLTTPLRIYILPTGEREEERERVLKKNKTLSFNMFIFVKRKYRLVVLSGEIWLKVKK